MDFFKHQETARRQTRWLLGGFVLAVSVFVLAVDMVLLWFISGHPLHFMASAPRLTLFMSALLGSWVAFTCWRKARELRAGGSAVAQALGGSLVEAQGGDLLDRRLLNVVEEMALAARVPVPKVFVLRDEPGINAFAAGRSPEDAAIAVTQGALQRFSREELQAVIAHEFSHVLNGDMALNLRMIAWLHGLYAITAIARQMIAKRVVRGRLRDLRILLAAVAIAIVGSVGMLIGRVLQAAVSRRRECLADASAVQFTRNPQALTKALLKIAGSGDGARILSPAASGAAHLFFAGGDASWVARLGSWFATHPPIGERIRAIDPTFETDRLPSLAARAGKAADALAATYTAARQGMAVTSAAVALADGDASELASGNTREGTDGMADRAGVSALRPLADVDAAMSLSGSTLGLVTLDTLQRALAHEHQQAQVQAERYYRAQPQHAPALFIAALLPRPIIERRAALEQVARVCGGKALPAIAAACNTIGALPPITHLPLLESLRSTLDPLVGAKREQLQQVLRFLGRHAGIEQMLHFCALRLLRQAAAAARDAPDATPVRLTDCTREIGLLFSVLAHVGHCTEEQAVAAYGAGLRTFLSPVLRPAFRAPDAHWFETLDGTLDLLRRLHPVARKTVAAGMAATIACDGRLAVAEAELLRITCTVIGTPLPALPVDALQPTKTHHGRASREARGG